MTYKYESILKTFEYSKANYQIISDFLLSGNMTNPNIMLKVDTITKGFKPNAKPRDWFRLNSTKSYISALINIKLEKNNSKLEKIIRHWIKTENIDKKVFSTEWVNNPLVKTTNSKVEIMSVHFELLQKSDDSKFIKLLKEFGLIKVKNGGKNRNGEALQGTWIHKDLSIKYAEWLDSKFAVWISQKIQELISDGVAWNEIRLITRLDYKPLTDAIAKYVIPKYAKMNKNYVYGRIANFINVKVMGQKAKDIRLEKGIEDDELTRDFFINKELKKIEEVQVFTEIVISHFQKHSFKEIETEIEKYQVKN